MKKNPLQLYVSGLIFAPAVSAVKRQFSRELPDFISMTHNVDSSWGAELGELQDSSSPACCAISTSGRVLAAGYNDMTMRLWDTITGNLLTSSRNSEFARVKAIAFSSDDKWLISCSSRPGKLQIWDLDKGTLVRTFYEDVGQVKSLVFTDGGQLLASPSGTWDFLTWDHTVGIQHHTLTRPLSEYASTKFSPNGLLLASHSHSTNIDLWGLVARNLQHTLVGHSSPIWCITFSTDGRSLASGDAEGNVIIWDTATGAQRQHIMKHMGLVNGIAFSPGGQLLASIHANFNPKTDKTEDEIAVWDLSGYSLTQVLRDRDVSSRLRHVVFCGDNKTLLSTGGPIRLWDATDASQNRQPHDSDVTVVVFSFDGQLLATVCRTGRILIWNVTTESITQNLGDRYNGNVLAFSPSNALLAFSSSPRVIELWNINAKTQQHSFHAFGKIFCVAFSADNQLIACLVDRRDIQIWDLTTGTLRDTISDSQNCPLINSIKFSPGSEYLFVASSASDALGVLPGWLIKAFRLPNTDTADFDFSVYNKKFHLSRDNINSIHDFPVFEFGTSQGDLDTDMTSESDDERTNDMRNQLAMDDEWLCFQGEKVLQLHGVQSQLEINGVWLYYKGKKVLLLPESHYPRCWASNNETVAIGHDSGGVTIIRISPQSSCNEFE